jgi:hypothetical protein
LTPVLDAYPLSFEIPSALLKICDVCFVCIVSPPASLNVMKIDAFARSADSRPASNNSSYWQPLGRVTLEQTCAFCENPSLMNME